MITINLLPQEFRVQEKSTSQISFVKIAVIAGVVFSLLTAGFYVDYLSVSFRAHKLHEESKAILPQSQQLKKLEEDVEKRLRPENSFLNEFVTASKPLTLMLNWISESLPDDSWLTEVRLSRDGEGGSLLVKGMAVPSKEHPSIEQIEIYMNRLKEKMPDVNLSLTTSRQQVEKVDVTQFDSNFLWQGMPVETKTKTKQKTKA